MKITYDKIEEMTLNEFAKKYDLEMVVRERDREIMSMPHIGHGGRFYAYFKRTEVKDGSILCGSFGNGATPEDAINNYACEISGKRLVKNAYRDDRVDIHPTRITAEWTED